MINKEQVENIVKEYNKRGEQSQWNWDDGLLECENELIDIFSKNIPETINFLEFQCSPEILDDISTIFERLSEKVQSKDLLDALHRIYNKMPENVQKTLKVDIEFAVYAYDGDYDSPFVKEDGN